MIEAPDMRLEGPHGSLRLKLVQYQFPSISDDDWDSNWLIVSGKAIVDGEGWQFVEACLTNFEAIRLADWLDGVAKGEVKNGIEFVEPNLQFDLQGNATVRVSFALESAPPWAAADDDRDRHGFEVAVGPELVEASNALRRQLVQFPIRGPRAH